MSSLHCGSPGNKRYTSFGLANRIGVILTVALAPMGFTQVRDDTTVRKDKKR